MDTSKHFMAMITLDLVEPIRQQVEGRELTFGSYSITLGLNAPSLEKAAALAEAYVLDRERALVSIEAAEFEALPFEEVPDHVLEEASANPENIGVYWASGRIFGGEE